MRYKYIAIVGASVILVVLTLAILMYYYNQNECPVGTFLCKNTTICKPQRNWCDDKIDCKHGDDEANCVDVVGYLGLVYIWLYRKSPELTCDSTNTPVNCAYTDCRVNCIGYDEIPRMLSVNVTTINLINNFVSRITANSFENYLKLDTLHLDNNTISAIEPNSFINQNDLFWLMLSNNSITEIRPGYFLGLNSLNTLRLDQNKISIADFSDFENSTSLSWINLNNNFLMADTIKFPYLPVLQELNINHNSLRYIPHDLFDGLPELVSLTLEENRLQVIDSVVFSHITQLIELVLSYNNISDISPDAFESLGNLKKLAIGNNPIVNLPSTLFNPLQNLMSLDVRGIDMDNAEKNMFNSFPNLTFIYFKKFYYCTTYAPKVQKCQPASDGVSSLSDLLSKRVLRVAVWGISSVTFLGNALVLWERFTAKDENPVLSIVIRNLAFSDMLMGIYLFVIAVEDLRYRSFYNLFANSWMSSEFCIFIGVLAMTSSEVSVMILSFLSVERFMLITAPLKRNHFMTPRTASTIMIIIWTVGVTLALIPAIHWKSSTRFYGVNGMCFPLHIDDPFLVGWEYSAFIFLGLNVVGLIIIIYVYFSMFISICKTRSATPLSIGDSEFALRFFLIIFTDSACWVPIIVLKLLALMSYPAPPDLHAWMVVFILPVNSAVNPLLYTFTTPKFRERLGEGCSGLMQSYVSRRHSTQESSQVTSSTVNNKIQMPTLNNKLPDDNTDKSNINEADLNDYHNNNKYSNK